MLPGSRILDPYIEIKYNLPRRNGSSFLNFLNSIQLFILITSEISVNIIAIIFSTTDMEKDVRPMNGEKESIFIGY
jgi:hypothetical protein